MADTKMILMNTGVEDEYLTGNPESTFFKQNIRQYTYFSQNWNISSPNFSETNDFFKPECKYSYRLPIQGDILSDMVLRIGVDTYDSCVCNLGSGSGVCPYNVIKKIELRYNDKVLETLDVNFINIFYELCSDIKNKKRYFWKKEKGYIHLPLPFWFTKNVGSGFPVWLLNNPQITMHIEMGNYDISIGNIQIDILSLYSNVTNNEKDTFKNSSLEYLIEQVDICNKINIENNTCIDIDLPRTPFIKYLAWNAIDSCPSIKCSGSGSGLNIDQYEEVITNSNIILNGNSLSGDMSPHQSVLINRHCYFKTPLYPNSDGSLYETDSILSLSKIHTYSFCLDPLKFQSTGFLSSDKFNTFKLKLNINSGNNDKTIHTYAVKNNIMRIKNGQLELLYN